ncbi:hypothetical protein DFH01_25580 [Falsiroseomonas bella]|uniref:Uncharacterized protein n=1 Tax=Falsiroseomonas bella TaxID=2184016 RepID=A0A317F5H4_9PROT|nr:hypothetical protein [Falsiroseomonas bella]PWS34390.1 hypothetical protein DFH01_25580 [Falsiroseomonas bella]
MALDEINHLPQGDHSDGLGSDAGESASFVADRRYVDADEAADDMDGVEVASSLEAEFRKALNLDTWTSGERMDLLAARLEREVELAAQFEDDMAPRVLKALEDGLPSAPDASRESGIYTLSPEVITRAIRNVLFNGLVEACDGTRVTVSTLPVTVVQIGICLTSYQGTGDGGSIGHRLYRHDIMRRNGNAEDEVLEFLSRRARRKNREVPHREFGDDGQPINISDMLCRALMIYAERAMLADRSERPWRLGHGGPMPHELIVGSGRNEMAFASLEMLRRLLLEHRRFIFVPSEISDEAVVTIANALHPLQYAVLRNTKDIIEGYITGSSYERPHYKRSGLYQAVRSFQEDVGSKVLLGVYRASALCPGRVFYAHEDHVHEAAQIVMADSALQEARGFPNLIDIADRTCKGMFEPGGLSAQVHAALARSGSPFRFLGERNTRA